MAFVQIIEFRTENVDEIRKFSDQWDDRAGSETTARRGIVGQDRDNPGRFFQIVFFDSYESAMKNSELPITHEFAEKMQALVEGPPTFYNLDVIDDRSWS